VWRRSSTVRHRPLPDAGPRTAGRVLQPVDDRGVADHGRAFALSPRQSPPSVRENQEHQPERTRGFPCYPSHRSASRRNPGRGQRTPNSSDSRCCLAAAAEDAVAEPGGVGQVKPAGGHGRAELCVQPSGRERRPPEERVFPWRRQLPQRGGETRFGEVGRTWLRRAVRSPLLTKTDRTRGWFTSAGLQVSSSRAWQLRLND
jgi:hypothetical protein